MINLLLIEDNPVSRIFYRHRIKRSAPDFTLHASKDMADARLALKEGFKPDIVVIDLTLSDSSAQETMSVFEVFKACGAKILAMSVDNAYEPEARRAGADDFYLKGTGEPLNGLVDKISALTPSS